MDELLRVVATMAFLGIGFLAFAWGLCMLSAVAFVIWCEVGDQRKSERKIK